MKVDHYELEAMLKELKKSKIKEVRVQGMQYRSPMQTGSTTIMYIIFEVHVTAKSGDKDVLSYVERIRSEMEFEKRRLNTAKKVTAEREQEIIDDLTEKKFEVKKGVYQKNGGR